MADENKARPEGKGKGKGKEGRVLSDRKRLSYLKIRYNEMRKETQALKAEMSALREKVGASKGKKDGAEDGGDE